MPTGRENPLLRWAGATDSSYLNDPEFWAAAESMPGMKAGSLSLFRLHLSQSGFPVAAPAKPGTKKKPDLEPNPTTLSSLFGG